MRLVILLGIIFGLNQSYAFDLAGLEGFRTGEVQKIEFDRKMYADTNGEVTLDLSSKTFTMSLDTNHFVIDETAEVYDATVKKCGERIIQATKLNRSGEGIKITITDYSKLHCRYRPEAKTVITGKLMTKDRGDNVVLKEFKILAGALLR
ncbi:hypothetical protein N9O57_01810 [bacterium]|nr:hypothetical protein [bacterium]